MNFISPDASRTGEAPLVAASGSAFSICTDVVVSDALTGHVPEVTVAQLRPYVGTPTCTLAMSMPVAFV